MRGIINMSNMCDISRNHEVLGSKLIIEIIVVFIILF
jgi:hypothetical protein